MCAKSINCSAFATFETDRPERQCRAVTVMHNAVGRRAPLPKVTRPLAGALIGAYAVAALARLGTRNISTLFGI